MKNTEHMKLHMQTLEALANIQEEFKELKVLIEKFLEKANSK
jgi:hypothetical protein